MIKGHPSVASCTPHFYKPYDLNDDYVECSICGQGWIREPSPDTWGDFTVMYRAHSTAV